MDNLFEQMEYLFSDLDVNGSYITKENDGDVFASFTHKGYRGMVTLKAKEGKYLVVIHNKNTGEFMFEPCNGELEASIVLSRYLELK